MVTFKGESEFARARARTCRELAPDAGLSSPRAPFPCVCVWEAPAELGRFVVLMKETDGCGRRERVCVEQ